MTKTVFVTGAAGFIGSRVARRLIERGDHVVAMVRDRDADASQSLRSQGGRLVQGDLRSVADIRNGIGRADAVIHLAGSYRVGIRAADRPAMYEANVVATERVVDAAIELGIPRIVYISTVNVLGNTHGRIPDETFRRNLADGFLSYYDETKYRAHQSVAGRAAAGAPIVTVEPGTVYGRGDHSQLGGQLHAAYDGTLPFIALGDTGISPTYVDDLANGIVAAMDRGRVGDAYIMAGQNIRLIDGLQVASRAGGHRLPRLRMPTGVLRIGARLAPNSGALVGQPPNAAEILRSSDGVTFWASSAKVEAELGYRSRALDQGVRDAFEHA